MKKKLIINGFMAIAAGLFFFSCNNNEAAKSGTGKDSVNITVTEPNKATGSVTKINERAAADSTKEKEANEENEKEEKK